MKTKPTIHEVLWCTRLSVATILCWPPPLGSEDSVMRRHNLCWWIVFCAVSTNISTFIYGIMDNLDDIVFAIKLYTEMCAMTSVLVKMAICRKYLTTIQILFADLEKFLKEATLKENELIQSYVDKCLVIHASTLVCGIFGFTFFVIAPFVTSQNLPGDTTFPFEINSFWLWGGLYILQSFSTFAVICMVNVDLMFAILLWYSGARMDMLSQILENALNAENVKYCVEKHQKLTEYIELLTNPVRHSAVCVNFMALSVAITGGFVLTRHPAMLELPKFGLLVGVAATELYLYAWPADHLAEMCKKFGDAAYHCGWIGNSFGMSQDVRIIIHRSQNPFIINVDGILPPLSLQYYGASISAAVSYFTTLRAVTAEDD